MWYNNGQTIKNDAVLMTPVAMRQVYKGNLTMPQYTKICPICNKQFVTPRQNRGKYCSHACSNKARINIKPKVCESCGAKYKPRTISRSSRFCSNECKDEANRKPIIRDELGRKQCNTCEKWLPTDQYYKSRYSNDGLRSQCNDCTAERGRINKQMRRDADGNFTQDDIKSLWNGQAGRCWYCQCDLNDTGYHIDHWIPITKGGTHDPRNLRLACPNCNLSKGNTHPLDWNGSGGLLL